MQKYRDDVILKRSSPPVGAKGNECEPLGRWPKAALG